MYETYERLARVEELLGNETILDALIQWMSDDMLNDFLSDLEKDYDLEPLKGDDE